MKITVQGKQVDVGAALSDHIDERLGHAVTKYFENALDATVVLSKNAHLFRCDISVHVGHDITVQSHGEATDPYACFEEACEKAEKRVRRYKRRLRDHHAQAKNHDEEILAAQAFVIAQEPDDVDEEEITGDAPIVIAETSTKIMSLSPSEAVMRLDLSNEDALLFKNRAHGGFNVVYRRQDGNIGWIDPQVPAT